MPLRVTLIATLLLVLLTEAGVLAPYAHAEANSETGQIRIEQRQEQLRKILLQREFQPRGNTLTAWDRLTHSVKQWIGERIADLWDAIPRGVFNVDPNSGFGRFLSNLAAFSGFLLDLIAPLLRSWRAILFCGVLGSALYLFYRWYKRTTISTKSKRSTGLHSAPAYVWTLEEIKKLGLTRAALAGLRELLRTDLCRRYCLSAAVTDREMCRTLTSKECAAELFNRTATLFEAVEFAGQPLAPEQLSALLNTYESTLDDKSRSSQP